MDLSYFESTNEEGEVIVNRPECKTVSDLERVIALGKPERVIEMFAGMVAVGEQWAWYDHYQEYLDDTAIYIDTLNSHETEYDEDGVAIKWIPPVEPVAPIRLATRSASEVLLPYYASRRAALYPEVVDFADAYVKSLGWSDSTKLDKYVADCLKVKEDIPKE